jgi:CDP-glucose 4,6-dehydratase
MDERNGQVENLVIDPSFWKGRRVFLTGHTGFKGAWTALLLRRLGAMAHGYALEPEDKRGLFVAANIEQDIKHTVGDIRDLGSLRTAIERAQPEIIIHMAAQSLVRQSYAEPVDTYAVNVMGTVNVLEAARHVPGVKAAIIVTSDKCYDNVGWQWGYREIDALGGHDPYSNSKGCAELVTDSYRRSFFYKPDSAGIASGRAGNVIGGGDWAKDRLIPDAMRAFMGNQALRIRNPAAVRPWQHVIDPVCAYLQLAERLVRDGHDFATAWNFGPAKASEAPVSHITNRLVSLWGHGARWEADGGEHPHEASYLKLDCSKAEALLGWRPLLDLEQALALTVEWYRTASDGGDLRALSLKQLDSSLQTRTSHAT